MNNLNKIFKNIKNPKIMGVLHCAPLLGYDKHPGLDVVEKRFIEDFKAMDEGGVDSIIIENNYDIPHYEKAKISTIPHLTDICIKARKMTDKPLGISVLWNDYETALSIAKIANFQFIRIPVYVDKVKTDYGIYEPRAIETIAFRKKINAENILIFSDVQVKHAKHLIKRPLTEAIKDAIKHKTDGIIITGKWTGDPPTRVDVEEAVSTAGDIPILLGSGVTIDNIKDYDVDGIILSSHFKGDGDPKEKDYHNIYTWKAEIKKDRVEKFMKKIK